MSNQQTDAPGRRLLPEWLRHPWGCWVLLILYVVGTIAWMIPGALKARDTPARYSCQDVMTRIDSAVQQYIEEFELEGRAQFVAMFGTEQKDWSPVLVGPDYGLRQPPRCTSHAAPPFWEFWQSREVLNDYSIADKADAEFPVMCNIYPEDHLYPVPRDP
ncbi:hypothetical protein KQI84_13100 [bacterium]|nr:hypothetical protein [bacterium]